MRTLQIICLILTIVGAINWGFVGLFDIDLVAAVFGGANSTMSTVIYALIALAGIVNLGLLFDMIGDEDHK